jgi:hypothetical protein
MTSTYPRVRDFPLSFQMHYTFYLFDDARTMVATCFIKFIIFKILTGANDRNESQWLSCNDWNMYTIMIHTHRGMHIFVVASFLRKPTHNRSSFLICKFLSICICELFANVSTYLWNSRNTQEPIWPQTQLCGSTFMRLPTSSIRGTRSTKRTGDLH